MAYNESSAERIRNQVQKNQGFVEKKMFGGICFLLNGNMACGILPDPIGADRYFPFGAHPWDNARHRFHRPCTVPHPTPA